MKTLIEKIKRFWKWLLLETVVSAATIGAIVLPNQINEVSKDKLTAKYEQATEIKAKYQIDGSSLKRKVIKNVELDKYKGEPKDEIKVTLGDVNSDNFTPDIGMKRWNEVSFKLKPRLSGVATKDKDPLFEGEKIRFKTPKMDFEMYDVPATETDEGSYKYIWYLNEKPATNKIEFDIETSGLDFFYQPELTPEEIAQGASRPENVVGSYAVYHSTKGAVNDINGKEYKVGKAFHIYRPHIIDASGAETWGNLHIENGIYSVEIPQEFLDKAVYPIKSNDIFGYETQGGTGSANYDVIRASKAAPSGGDGTVSNIKCYCTWSTASSYARALIYLVSDNSLVGDTNDDTLINSLTWWQFDFSSPPSVINATNYWLAMFGGESSAEKLSIRYDTGTDGDSDQQSIAYAFPSPPSAPNPWVPSNTLINRKYSIYATYTPSGGGATPI